MPPILVIAPHPDDETLGVGGTLLRNVAEGNDVHWLIMTRMVEELGFSAERIKDREEEISLVAQAYGFAETHKADLRTTALDTYPLSDVIGAISNVVQKVQPEILYLPHPGDAHSDHKVVFEAASACTKSFRYPSVNSVRLYETISETDFGLNPAANAFHPNLFVNIDGYLDRKLEIMRLFKGELGDHPFPRNEDSIKSLAILRGQVAGCAAAEAFMITREIV